MELTEKKQGKRTLLYEGDLHVGTIFEQERPKGKTAGSYQWYVASTGGRATSADEARAAIETELAR